MLIPKMLITCIENERGMECVAIHKCTFHLEHYRMYQTEEQKALIRKKQSDSKKAFWANTSKVKLKEMCKKRAESLKKYLNGLSKEELSARTAKASAKLLSLHKDSVEGPRLKAIDRKQAEKINNVVTEELPRINNYSGVISLKDLEAL